VIIGTFGAMLATSGAIADPTISDKRAQAAAIIGEIQMLDAELGAAAERYNGATFELERLASELRSTRVELTRARNLQRVTQGRVAARLRVLYVNGTSASSIAVLLGARSLDDVLDRIELASRVGRQDAALVRDAERLRRRVETRTLRLDTARRRQAEVVQQRAAETTAIHARLAERERLLASVRDEITQLEEAERRRQAELERRARERLALQQAAAAAAASRAREQTEAAAAVSSETSPPAEEREEAPVAAPTAPAPAPADAGRAAQVVAIAMRYLGVPYKWGGASPSEGFDCSGLTTYVFAQIGVSLPHFAAAQYGMGSPVAKEDLQPGDLVFFRSLGHMGMYIGGGSFIHAPRTGDVVKISSLSESYYVANWVGARRVI
jgi:cell wall-associated NlpC family hydrolase